MLYLLGSLDVLFDLKQVFVQLFPHLFKFFDFGLFPALFLDCFANLIKVCHFEEESRKDLGKYTSN
jgi:hypothetical protein